MKVASPARPAERSRVGPVSPAARPDTRERVRLGAAWVVWAAGVLALLGFCWSWYRTLTGPTEVVSWVLIPAGVIVLILLLLQLAATSEGARVPTIVLAGLVWFAGRAQRGRAEEVLGEVPELLGFVPLTGWMSILAILACLVLLAVVPAERPDADSVSNVVVTVAFAFLVVFGTNALLDRDWTDVVPAGEDSTEDGSTEEGSTDEG